MGSKKTGGGVENVYAAAEKWVDCALRSDDSLFTPGTPIWTSKWLGELRERFLERHDEFKGPGFFEKLEPLLTGSPPEVIQLMAEAVYVTYLIVWKGAVGRTKKEERIKQVLEWSPTLVAIPDDLADGLEPGIADPGGFFRNNFAIHPGYVIEFVEHWKDQEPSQWDHLLAYPWGFKTIVMDVPFRSSVLCNNPNSPTAQKQALLHLIFPDTFEGIVSINSKKLVAEVFAYFLDDPPPEDVDRKLEQIRAGFETHEKRAVIRFFSKSIFAE